MKPIFRMLRGRAWTSKPHLHRFKSLNEIYVMPPYITYRTYRPRHCGIDQASVSQPFLIGPYEESWQWFSAVAGDCSASFAIIRKERLGDREVHTVAAIYLCPRQRHQ
jgi:ribose-phosphate pyrophosphokinase